jgi:integrase
LLPPTYTIRWDTTEGGGSWVTRRFVGKDQYRETKTGVADDLQDADGLVLLSFKQAQDAARIWWRREQRGQLGHAPDDDGPYTVARALTAYFAHREQRGSKGLLQDRSAATARIIPAIGGIDLAKLTTKQIRDWHAQLVVTPKFSRAIRVYGERKSRALDLKDADATRARRATANRTLTVLKAALNHAFHKGRIGSDEAWRKAKPFRAVDSAVVRFLSADECRKIANTCQGAFRHLVRAALLTGCRYGELTRMRFGDFNPQSGTITVRESKSGTPRHVAINDEGQALFGELGAGKKGVDPIFVRDDGKPWGKSHQQRPLQEASIRVKIDPPATFHILRHTTRVRSQCVAFLWASLPLNSATPIRG